MSEPKYREWILETIDSLRSRKARPDLERICRMVRRRHGSDPDKTRAELEKLIQEQTVLKVSYKGSISYRNAAKVQRKCRKRTEQTTDSGGESAREQTKHASFNNNGDSALSLTDQEECEDREPEESGVNLCPPDPLPQTSPSNLEKEEKILPQPSGNSFVSCGATVCSAGSVKASASKDKRLVTEAGGRDASSARDARHEGSDDDGKEQKTCRNKLPASPKLKGSGAPESPDESSADLGDRLVDAVRSLSERHRGSAATRGHAPPGLKEILGYLSTQSGMPGEKLTRNRVKVVLEREIERGRLRRTRLGHITLHARGMGAAKPSARLLKSALQDRHLAKKEEVKEEERMEVEGEDNGTEENIAGSAEDVPVSVSDGGPTGVTACTDDPTSPDMEVTTSPVTSEGKSLSSSSLESSNQCSLQQEVDVGGSEEQTMSVEPEDAGTEKNTETPDQPHPSMEDQVNVMSETVKAPSSMPIRNYQGFKLEVGVSSCLLTPSASPGAAEERGMNEGIGGFVKSETSGMSPVDWTVADVASYFTAAGFPEQALAFRTQEIDGKSLLLMQRNDVLTGLSIRLGPALKIYERHVKVLQRTHFQDDEAFC
ncbi:sterile alpha motif domain-containing protein 1 [Megalobrama amblycephala]|uniref:sterile alpha motif domain-containing protein 1 n=1 Tax=Megalobrama amblycephala TaxID=75352 RepID=UPI0020146BBE|nr:sterile alpha motif domain-containing protein 1 [Megalobrama amblycephala]